MMDFFQDSYFKLHRRLMSLLGIWYTQPYKERLPRYCIISFIYLWAILELICQFFLWDFDFQRVVVVVQIFILALCFASAYCTAILRYGTIQKIYRSIIGDFLQLTNQVEIKIIEKHRHEGKLFLVFNIITFTAFTILVFLPLLLRRILSTDKRAWENDLFPLLLCTNYFIDREAYYYLVSFYQASLLIVACTAAVTCYWSYFWGVQHTCARFSIIVDKIQRPFRDIQQNSVPLTPIDFSNWLMEIIQYFTKTIEFVGLLNSISEYCYLFQMFLALLILIIDILCVPAIIKDSSKIDFFMFILIIIATLHPIYINCFIGQRLMDYSINVYREVCLIPIYHLSLKTQKLLFTMLILNAKPCTISIGKFFVSSHEFFSNLLRTSLSFAMIVRSTQSI